MNIRGKIQDAIYNALKSEENTEGLPAVPVTSAQ